MNKNNSIKLFIFLVITLTCVIKTYGSTEAEQSIQTAVQPAVAVEKSLSSIEKATADPKDGTHTGFSSVFNLQTNGTDDNYDFIISSKILTADGEVSAYGNNGQILFAHTLALPLVSAVNDAKVGGNNNKNVIAYPVTATVTEPMSINFANNYKTYGDCYVVKVNSAQEGTITHSVNQTPVSGSYSIAQDQAGEYKVTVYFTTVSK